MRRKCPYSELFWSAFSHIRTEYGEIRSSYNLSYNLFCKFLTSMGKECSQSVSHSTMQSAKHSHWNGRLNILKSVFPRFEFLDQVMDPDLSNLTENLRILQMFSLWVALQQIFCLSSYLCWTTINSLIHHDLLCKPMEWFLYDLDLRLERVNTTENESIPHLIYFPFIKK